MAIAIYERHRRHAEGLSRQAAAVAEQTGPLMLAAGDIERRLAPYGRKPERDASGAWFVPGMPTWADTAKRYGELQAELGRLKAEHCEILARRDEASRFAGRLRSELERRGIIQ